MVLNVAGSSPVFHPKRILDNHRLLRISSFKEAICFHFQIQSSEILFTASNLYDPLKRMNKDSSTGIGLSTVKRRLDFLYAGRYNLRINEENGYFGVSLICCAGI